MGVVVVDVIDNESTKGGKYHHLRTRTVKSMPMNREKALEERSVIDHNAFLTKI